MMHPADRNFMRRLLKKVEEIDIEKTLQVRSASASDYADYKERCGYLRALDDVRGFCKDIQDTDDEARPT